MDKITRHYTVEQLLNLEGREFIINSYLAILGRNPDPDGYANYIRLLKAGVSMESILRALGTAQNERINMIPGLADLINNKKTNRRLNLFSRKAGHKKNITNVSEILDVNFDTDNPKENQNISLQQIIESINNLSKAIAVNQQNTNMLITSHIDSLEQITLDNFTTEGRVEQQTDKESANSLGNDLDNQAREKVLDISVRTKENINCTAGVYKYVAENDDPQLMVKTNGVFTRGWYRIDILIDSSEPIGIITLFPGYFGEDEASHDTSVQWPYKSGEISTYILYLDNLACFFRVDPASRRVAFNITHISIKKISKDFVAESMVISLDTLSALFTTNSEDIPSTDELLNDYRLAHSKYLSAFRRATNYINDNLPYLIWIQNNEPLWRRKMIAFANAEKNSINIQHKISIIIPVFNPKIEFLIAAIESVIAQSYRNWELVLADDASTNPAVQDLLNEYRDKEPRIKVVFRKENGHISKATNSALKIATGDYIAFMDHDDTLDENALTAVAQSFCKHPDAALIYSDEDKIDEAGNRFFPHFKTDWNPDLILEHNYITHFCVVKTCLVNEELYMDSECNGAQDYDFLLRIFPYLNQANVIHIPWILYHWRAHKESTAFSSKVKTYSDSAGQLALEKFCSKNKIKGSVISLGNNYFRIKRDIIDNVFVSIIIPTNDKVELLSSCIESIYNKTTYRNFEIIIVDNNSREQKTFDYFKACTKLYDDVTIFHYYNDFNWSAINNFAAQQAKGEVLLFLNNDIEVISPTWLEEMISHAQRPEVGCVGAKLLGSSSFQVGNLRSSLPKIR